MKARAHVLVSGRVQGVFFRSETSYEAKRRHVNGWIRNTPDGKVEAVFEGDEEDVNKLVEFCRRGPRGAKVTSVTLVWESYSGVFTDFDIEN